MVVDVIEETPVVREAADLRRLSVAAASAADLRRLGVLGTPDPDGAHVWLDIAALREAGAATLPAGEAGEWRLGFDAMIEFAAGHGFVHPDGLAVRAHIEGLS